MPFSEGDKVKSTKDLVYGNKIIVSGTKGVVVEVRTLPSGAILDYKVHFDGDQSTDLHAMEDDLTYGS